MLKKLKNLIFGYAHGLVDYMPNVDLAMWGSYAWLNPGSSAPIANSAIASSATIAPTSPICKISGTESIATITIPFTGFLGRLTLIATGAWTMTTTGNIATNFTAVASQAVSFVYDGALWYPEIAD